MRSTRTAPKMRVISWNVNGIRAVESKGFTKWLLDESPDILCVQETKAEPGQLSSELKAPLDKNGKAYRSYWASAKKRGYSGVAIFTKKEPLEAGIVGNPIFDDEGRLLKADYGDFVLLCAYFPNSQEAGARLLCGNPCTVRKIMRGG